MRYQFTISERELEIVLAGIGLVSEEDAKTGHDAESKEARDLLVRLDMDADEQFIAHEYPQHDERERIRMPDGSLSASRFIAECDRKDRED